MFPISNLRETQGPLASRKQWAEYMDVRRSQDPQI